MQQARFGEQPLDQGLHAAGGVGSTAKPSIDFQGANHSWLEVHMPCRVVTPSEMTTRAFVIEKLGDLVGVMLHLL